VMAGLGGEGLSSPAELGAAVVVFTISWTISNDGTRCSFGFDGKLKLNFYEANFELRTTQYL